MRFTVLASAVLLSACLGQSGSEVLAPPRMNPMPIDPHPAPPGIPPQPHCPCDGLREYQQLRATVMGVESFATITNLRRYALRVEEVLSDAQRGEESLQPGDRVGGYWTGTRACGGEEQAPIAEGTQVLAFYRRGWQDGTLCCEYIACSDDCPRDQDSDDGNPAHSAQELCNTECMTQTAAACAQHRDEAVMRGELMLIPWGDSFVVGTSESGTATIAEGDLHALTLDRDACMAALDDRYDTLYPPEPSKPNVDADDAPAPGAKPLPSEPAPSMPMSMPMGVPPPPPASATPPDAGINGTQTPPPPTNPTAPAVGPPPAHPEESRVRCK